MFYTKIIELKTLSTKKIRFFCTVFELDWGKKKMRSATACNTQDHPDLL